MIGSGEVALYMCILVHVEITELVFDGSSVVEKGSEEFELDLMVETDFRKGLGEDVGSSSDFLRLRWKVF